MDAWLTLPVKYCSTAGCPHQEHPLAESCSVCPDCGESALRLSTNRSGYPCPGCGEVNLVAETACWHCQADLTGDVRSIRL